MAILNKRVSPVELHDVKLSAEEKLWRAVMATAIFDALHTPLRTPAGKYKLFTELKDINAAREWFEKKTGTFSTVCEALNLDEDMVHKRMMSKIRQRKFVERMNKA